jgi:flagellar motor switch protein FliN/FliY
MNQSNVPNESNESIERTGNAAAAPLEPAADSVVMSPDTSTSAMSLAGPLLLGVKLPIRVLLGRTQLCLRDVAQLGSGSVVELDCSPNDPVDVIVNDRVIAHGEVVVVAGNYGVRITRIAGAADKGDTDGRSDLLNLSEKVRQ